MYTHAVGACCPLVQAPFFPGTTCRIDALNDQRSVRHRTRVHVEQICRRIMYRVSNPLHACVSLHAELQGWEESVDAAMTHLLRTSLAKVAKESAPSSGGQTPQLSMPPNTEKLKKHISIVCDRLNKGARLTLRPAAPPTSPRSSPVTSRPPPLLALSPRADSPSLRGAA